MSCFTAFPVFLGKKKKRGKPGGKVVRQERPVLLQCTVLVLVDGKKKDMKTEEITTKNMVKATTGKKM